MARDDMCDSHREQAPCPKPFRCPGNRQRLDEQKEDPTLTDRETITRAG
jgi:hypothetical protein